MLSAEYSNRSQFFEQVVEHVFISELLQEAIYRHEVTIEVLRGEIDASGYDIVLECNGVLRHVQLKTSYEGSKTSRQKVHLALAEKPSGCVVWIIRHEDQLTARMRLRYLVFGNTAGKPLPTIEGFPIATHTKPNSEGVKSARPYLRVIPKNQFRSIATTDELFRFLFGLSTPLQTTTT